ncbi:MAG: OmpH family outer membrane protein [Flavobacteriales bacterium]|nr:OmpH family outer membrane protein [Flavobacteriales bacterium]
MSNNTTRLLIIWNVVLTALAGWALFRPASPAEPQASPEPTPPVVVQRDSTALKDAHIAYFFMDSLQQRYALVKEQGDRLRAEGRRLETNLQSEMSKAQSRYQALMGKDHTYSTQAEIQKDEEELQSLMGRIQELQSRSEQQLARMEVDMLSSISLEIEGFLEEYNRAAGFDYIFSVQNGGQIWVGNPDLDITDEVIAGLNARHAANKKADRK